MIILIGKRDRAWDSVRDCVHKRVNHSVRDCAISIGYGSVYYTVWGSSWESIRYSVWCYASNYLND